MIDKTTLDSNLIPITFKLNGDMVSILVPTNRTLLDLLRDQCNVHSLKAACWRGDCGICTILINGKPMKSCLILACEIDGQELTTIEGISAEGRLTRIQEAFITNGAVQCGFCTSAFILVAESLFKENPTPFRKEITEAINGVLCRCTGYQQIIDALMEISEE